MKTTNATRSHPPMRPFVLMTLGLALAGAAHAQERITALDAQALDWFGYDVAAHGDTTVVGAFRDDDNGESAGSAHVLHTPGDRSPAYLQKLVLDRAFAGDRAGFNVAIGDGLIAVTAPGRQHVRSNGTSITGVVAIFEEVQGRWVQLALLDDPARSEGDLFGESVAIAENGEVLVGAPRDDTAAPDAGAVFVFQRQGKGFVRTARILAPDGGTHDYFGHDLAVDGQYGVATAYNDDDRGVNAGAAYALRRRASGWEVEQKLVAGEGAHFDLFGTCAAISGRTIVVGAPQNEDTDADARSNEGLVVVFERKSNAFPWVETMVLRPGKPDDDHRFGIDVAINSDVIVVGASHSDAGLLNSGAAHIFSRRARDWFEVDRCVAAVPQAYDYLGLSVAAGDSAVIVGVPGANGTAVGTGAVDVLGIEGRPSTWGSTFCHSDGTIAGFKKMGGAPAAPGELARLCPAGTESLTRDDMILRALNLPQGAVAALFIGGGVARQQLGGSSSVFCLDRGSFGVFRFEYRVVGADGRYVVRRPLGRIEDTFPGSVSAMVGRDLFAQVAYVEQTSQRVWHTTNALRFKLTN